MTTLKTEQAGDLAAEALTAGLVTDLATDLAKSLAQWFAHRNQVMVALSGGVDSSVLAVAAMQTLGRKNVLCVTGISDSLASSEASSVRAFCQTWDLRHMEVSTQELAHPEYVANRPDRCFHCKDILYQTLSELAAQHTIDCIVDGTHADDLKTHRPGHQAAQNRKVLSPFVDLKAQKAQIRALARMWQLTNAERPAAPCLSSRVAYGVSVTQDRLQRIAQAEELMRSLGFLNVRVRLHEHIARIEIPHDEMAAVLPHAQTLHQDLRRLGFTYVTLDLGGLRSGSLLEVLS